MIRSRLRVYCGPENEPTTVVTSTSAEKSQQVTVPAGEIFSALADAVSHGRAWLQDFEDEEVTVSTDLYEVILAYQHFRRPSA